MVVQKYLNVIPCLCLDGVYLPDFNGVVIRDYYDSEQEAWDEIEDFKQSLGRGEEHFPMLVILETSNESLTDEYGFDWNSNTKFQKMRDTYKLIVQHFVKHGFAEIMGNV